MMSKEYKSCLLFILLRLPLAQYAETPCGKTKAGVVTALQAHFWSGCVFLAVPQQRLHEDILLMKTVVQMQILLSERRVPTAPLDATALNSTDLSLSCPRNRALYVLLSSGEETRHHLQQLFARVSPSEPRWLLFLDSAFSRVEGLLSAVDVPFDCEFLVASGVGDTVELREVFRVSRTLPLQTVLWGTWSRRDGLRAPIRGLYQRRNNLQGITFIAAALHHPPFTYLSEDIDGKLQVHGFIGDIGREMAKILNFSLIIVEADDKAYGVRRTDGSWNGALGMVLGARVNMTLNPFQINPTRSDVVDFTVPILKTRFRIYIQTPEGSERKWSALLAPFGFTVWLTVGAVIFFTACCMAALQRVAQTQMKLEELHLHGHFILDSLLCVWGSFLGQGYYGTPQVFSGRLVYWTSFMTGVILLSAYTANFTSELTVPRTALPFTNLQGLLEDHSYGFRVVKNFALYQTFQESNDTVMEGLYVQKLRPVEENLPQYTLMGFRQICEERLAFMTSKHERIFYHNDILCELSELSEESLPFYAALVLPKKSPYRRIVNFMLQKILRSGVLRKLYLQWLPVPPAQERSLLRDVQLEDMVPLLTLCAAAVLLGVTVLLLELCLHHNASKAGIQLHAFGRY